MQRESNAKWYRLRSLHQHGTGNFAILFFIKIYDFKEFDGSDSGASPDEAVSWGKLRDGIDPVKISADATLVFPLLVAQTFAKAKT